MENRLKETDRYWNVLSLAPLCLLLFFLTIIPLLSLIYTSFFKVTWDGGYLYEGIGFQNFFDLAAKPQRPPSGVSVFNWGAKAHQATPLNARP